MTPSHVLMLLLKKLYERQSWCPYCCAEHGHNGNCPLKNVWPPVRKK